MSKGTILITDSLFIFGEHERMIHDAGYDFFRLDKPEATEQELCEAVKGKVGYILGGVEKVTKEVVKSADKLKVISFTGAGYSEFVPGYEEARKRGIAITAAKGGNADAVAEFAITLCLNAIRDLPALTHRDGPKFLTTRSAGDTVLGVVGYGDVGSRVVDLARKLGFSVLVHSRTKPKSLPSEIRFVSLGELVKNSNVISVHVDKINGEGVLGRTQIDSLSEGAAIINVAFETAVDLPYLQDRLRSGVLKYFADHPISQIRNYPVGAVVATNSQTAFNTQSALRNVSNQTTRSLLSVLETGQDEYRVV